MTKAKPIDRVELTRQKFGEKLNASKSTPLDLNPSKSTGLDREELTASNSRRLDEHREGYSTCPNCGQETLIHEDGCMHCRSCGWSACG